MTKHIINLYYPSLMTFLVFTFADGLLRGIIQGFTVEILLYVILWAFLTIQTTFAYTRLGEIEPEKYPIKALVSDCLDIIIVIYICAAIGGVFSRSEGYELTSYMHLSVPFIILAINQFSWFIIVRSFDIPAIFRICILFIGMLAISISEVINHSLLNLVAIVTLIVMFGVLRAINKSPKTFRCFASKLWTYTKKRLA